MAKICIICGKGSHMAGQRKKLMSRYNPTPKKRIKPNLQTITIPVGITRKKYKHLAGQKVIMCAKCIKAMAKTD